ncbi:MAG: hypothetical protein IKH42_05890 [Lachnospiraceae bacterium]|nr:hypothetical protein [Lachnospiraceae bacterium]MBR3580729.1 hypothetical protein [Lachnospiraceae bacterium]
MDRYKNFVKIEEIKGLLREEKYEEALELADGIDPAKLKDNLDCMVIGEVYLNNGMLGRAKECYSVVYDRRKTRRVAMELVNICIRLKKVDEAEKYYADFKKMAPNDYYNYIFKYKIDRLKGKSLREQAASLEELKRVEFYDTWGYELAKLYHKMGDAEKCIKTCDDIIIWFGDGEAVDKARALKAYYSGEISLRELSGQKVNEGEVSDIQGDADQADTENTEAVADIPEEAEKKTSISEKYRATWNGEPQVAVPQAVPVNGAVSDDNETDEVVTDAAVATEKLPDTENAETFAGEENTETVISADSDDNSDVAVADTDAYDAQEVEYTATEKLPEEDYIEEEYTEEDLKIADEKIAYTEPQVSEESIKKAVTRPVHETDLFEDEIAKAVEQALIEDSEDKPQKEEQKPEDMTRVWSRPDIESGDAKKDADRTIVRPPVKKQEKPSSRKEEDYDDDYEKSPKSQLLEAVERELGFVEDKPKDKDKTPKKGWMSRFKEKIQEKEKKKQDDIKKQQTLENEEKLRKEREAELEKQRFIESERKKDKRKFLDHQKQLARLANEKALQEEKASLAGKETVAAVTAASDIVTDAAVDTDDFTVDITESLKEVQISTERVPKDGIYTPKQLKCIEVPENSVIAGYLKKSGKTLEDYFGFFACQKDMNSQILKCLERLADNTEETMNYCIIGERGTGKKAIAHGFAKFMADSGFISASQTVWTDANKVNQINLKDRTEKLRGRCLVVNQAGDLSEEAIWDISDIVKKLGRNTMIVIADYRKNMVELFRNREKFEDMFRPRVIIPAFNQEDLFDYVDYKIGKAGFVFESEAYDLMSKRIKGILRATEEGALARTEKYLVKTLDNAEQRNGEAYIRQTLEHEKHVRSNVIISKDIPNSI